MCIKTNKVVKQEVGIWRVQKHYPQYGIPIWRLWPNIRFLSSIVTEKSATKNILDGRKDRQTDRGKTVYPPPPSGSVGIKTEFCLNPTHNRQKFCLNQTLNKQILYLWTVIQVSKYITFELQWTSELDLTTVHPEIDIFWYWTVFHDDY